MGDIDYAQKQICNFVKFVHTYLEADAIITIVKPPNTLYSFCYTPIRRNTFSKKGSRWLLFLCYRKDLVTLKRESPFL